MPSVARVDKGSWFRRPGAGAAAIFAVLGAVALLTGPGARAETAGDNKVYGQPGEGADIIVGDIAGVKRWGSTTAITAYSFAATACNVGTSPAFWHYGLTPVVSQNLFDLKDGRFQQIGQSWIKHPTGPETGDYCGACLPASAGSLGVNCSDTYAATGNGAQTFLGMKYSVNPYTGDYAIEDTSATGNAIFKRLQVHNYDLDPALNPGAKYFVEVRYVSPDDATTGNGENSATYRPVTVSGSAATGVYNLTLTGPNVIGQPAIMAWKAADPSVTITAAQLPDDGTLYLGTKVTYRGNGLWRYEYAIENFDAAQAPLAISIPIPAGSTVSGPSFHDVEYHSGDIQDNGTWARTTGPTSVQWKANTLVLNGQVPNALRWGTLYNFRIDVNAAPGTHALLLGYSVAPHPTYELSLTVPALTPSVCDNDGVCDPGETCASCAADCASQGGGTGCCGNGSCEAGETGSGCFADCGQPTAAETMCGDGIDGDRDGLPDCLDTNCCADPACDGFDVDGDGVAQACDCNDAGGTAWATPGEVTNLRFANLPESGPSWIWNSPAEIGGSAVAYDLIRATDARQFDTATTCVALADPAIQSATDPEDPTAGAGFFYLVRARNACPSLGPLGSSSSGTPHVVPACP